jgi:predicted 2-oxoglutarate/Fe(II)-dependent dioxygenase YbiX
MPTADFFARLGLFVAREFLDPMMCSTIIQQARGQKTHVAAVNRKQDGSLVDQDIRNTQVAPMSPNIERDIRAKLAGLQPDLERHFRVELNGFEDPQLLRYDRGSFFRAHADAETDEDRPIELRRRKVSVSILLNNQAQNPGADEYDGGSLVFYDLMGHPKARTCGFPLHGEAGVLIAFPSLLIHEVQDISAGERYSIVTWFS